VSADLYQVLNVPRDATAEQIRKAYRAIVFEAHPDKVGNDQAALARYRDATRAYKVLSDPFERKRYDRGFTEIASVSDLFLHNALGKKTLQVMLPSAPAAPQAGADRFVAIRVPETLLHTGGTFSVSLTQSSGQPLDIELVIPPHADRLRYVCLTQLGYAGKNGGPPGDLRIILVRKESHGRIT